MSHLTLRDGELERLHKRFPDKIPVFITKSSSSKDTLPEIRKHKFLVPSHFIMAEFVMIIRKWLVLTPEMAIFIFINNTLPLSSMTMGEIYVKYKDNDGVLRMNYAAENTFG